MRTYYREKKFRCGSELMDLMIFPVYKKQGKRKCKAKPTSDVQSRNNQINSERQLSRLVHTNFTKNDYKLDLTYRVVPETNEEAIKDIQNFIRRVRNLYSKSGIELKYIWVMEAGEKRGRLHFHLIISGGVDRTALEKLWGKGRANAVALQPDENGLEALVKYMVKKPLLYRRWSSSKNLKKPKETQNDSKYSRRTVKKMIENYEMFGDKSQFEKLYPDYTCTECRVYHNNINQGYYVFLRMFKKQE